MKIIQLVMIVNLMAMEVMESSCRSVSTRGTVVVPMAGPICHGFLDFIEDNIALALDVETVTHYCRHAQSLHGVCSHRLNAMITMLSA